MQQNSAASAFLNLLTTGSEMVALTVLGVLLDFWLGTMPIGTIIFTLAGLFAAFRRMIQWSRQMQRTKVASKDDRPTQSNGIESP